MNESTKVELALRRVAADKTLKEYERSMLKRIADEIHTINREQGNASPRTR